MQLQHLLGIEPLHPQSITEILDLADHYAEQNRSSARKSAALVWLYADQYVFRKLNPHASQL